MDALTLHNAAYFLDQMQGLRPYSDQPPPALPAQAVLPQAWPETVPEPAGMPATRFSLDLRSEPFQQALQADLQAAARQAAPPSEPPQPPTPVSETAPVAKPEPSASEPRAVAFPVPLPSVEGVMTPLPAGMPPGFMTTGPTLADMMKQMTEYLEQIQANGGPPPGMAMAAMFVWMPPEKPKE